METIINYTIGVVGLILAVIGIYLTLRSNKKKEPVYSIKSNNLISGSASTLENLNIAYKGYRVENLTVSKMLFYNSGTETILGTDLKTIHPLSISSELCRILDGSVLQVNNDSNDLKVSYDEGNKNVYIDFDYLDQNQGAVIQIVHTGLSSENLDVHGDIIGVQKLAEVSPDKFRSSPSPQRILREIIARTAFIPLAMALMYLAGILNDVNIPFVFVFALLILVFFEMLPLGLRTLQGRSIPKGLEKFTE